MTSRRNDCFGGAITVVMVAIDVFCRPNSSGWIELKLGWSFRLSSCRGHWQENLNVGLGRHYKDDIQCELGHDLFERDLGDDRMEVLLQTHDVEWLVT